MSKVKFVKKGYTFEIESSENDADNIRTEFYTVKTKERAKLILKICEELFCGSCNGEGGIGNLCEGDEDTASSRIYEWVENNPEILPKGVDPKSTDAYDYVMELNSNLLGYSEWYISRIADEIKVSYSPEDIYVESIDLEDLK